MGFDANEFYIQTTAFAAGVPATFSVQTTVERDCELVAIAFGVGAVNNDLAMDMSLFVANADTGVNIVLPILAADSGVVAYPDAQHFFTKGDTFRLVSDGVATTVPVVTSTLVCRI